MTNLQELCTALEQFLFAIGDDYAVVETHGQWLERKGVAAGSSDDFAPEADLIFTSLVFAKIYDWFVGAQRVEVLSKFLDTLGAYFDGARSCSFPAYSAQTQSAWDARAAARTGEARSYH